MGMTEQQRSDFNRAKCGAEIGFSQAGKAGTKIWQDAFVARKEPVFRTPEPIWRPERLQLPDAVSRAPVVQQPGGGSDTTASWKQVGIVVAVLAPWLLVTWAVSAALNRVGVDQKLAFWIGLLTLPGIMAATVTFFLVRGTYRIARDAYFGWRFWSSDNPRAARVVRHVAAFSAVYASSVYIIHRVGAVPVAKMGSWKLGGFALLVGVAYAAVVIWWRSRQVIRATTR